MHYRSYRIKHIPIYLLPRLIWLATHIIFFGDLKFSVEEPPAPRQPRRRPARDVDIAEEPPAPRQPRRRPARDVDIAEEPPAPRQPGRRPARDVDIAEEPPAPRQPRRRPARDVDIAEEPPAPRQPGRRETGFGGNEEYTSYNLPGSNINTTCMPALNEFSTERSP